MENEAKHIHDQISKLHSDARYGKDRHFSASDRKTFYNTAFGVAVVFINILIGSTIIKYFGFNQEIITSFLSFIAASLAGIHAFFNFQKAIENHRRVGNMYIEISKRIDFDIAEFEDGILNKEEFSKRCRDLTEKYLKINEEAEKCPAGERDFARALKIRKRNDEYKNKCIKDNDA